MSQHEVVRLISNIEVFNDFTNDDFAILSPHFHRVTFREWDVIVNEGDPGTDFYVVVRGMLKVFLPQTISGQIDLRASDVKLNILKDGDCFGEYSLIDKRLASASIVAISEGELIKIAAEDFEVLLDAHDAIGKKFYRNALRILIRRLRMREREYDMLLIAPE